MEWLVSMSIVEPHTCGRCLTLTHSMPWFGHSVQNRHAARDVYDCDVAYQQRRLRSELASGRVSIPPHLLNSAQDLLELSPYRVVNAAELIRSAEPSSLRPLPKWSRGCVVSREHVFQCGLGNAPSAGNEPRQPPLLGQARGCGRRFDFVEQSA